MRECRVVASREFEADLNNAVAYHVKNVGLASASRILDNYDATVARLQSMPCYGARVGSQYRWCYVGAYIAVYRVDKDAHIVVLHRLYYMTSNWKENILGDDGW